MRLFIRFYALIGLAIISQSACRGAQDDPVQNISAKVYAKENQILIEGRTLKTPRGHEMGFPGTKLNFVPHDMNMKLQLIADKPDMSVDVSLEGSRFETVSLVQGLNEIDLGFLWDNNPHDHIIAGCDVEVVRRNESWQGLLTFVDATSSGDFRSRGETNLAPLEPAKTKLLFIGDSITAGAGTESRMNEAGQREAVSNARVAYPRVLGERLDAQVHHVAYGGRGVTRDWQGITDTNNAPQFYDRVLPDNPDHLWDPADYPADIVSIMLGTNDFNPGIPGRTSWTAAYRKFVSRVRGDYPQAQVFLISSPMTDGEKGDALKAYVRAVAESFETPQVQYIEVGKYHGEPWDSHPTAAEHQKIADELEPFFRAALDE